MTPYLNSNNQINSSIAEILASATNENDKIKLPNLIFLLKHINKTGFINTLNYFENAKIKQLFLNISILPGIELITEFLKGIYMDIKQKNKYSVLIELICNHNIIQNFVFKISKCIIQFSPIDLLEIILPGMNFYFTYFNEVFNTLIEIRKKFLEMNNISKANLILQMAQCQLVIHRHNFNLSNQITKFIFDNSTEKTVLLTQNEIINKLKENDWLLNFNINKAQIILDENYKGLVNIGNSNFN